MEVKIDPSKIDTSKVDFLKVGRIIGAVTVVLVLLDAFIGLGARDGGFLYFLRSLSHLGLALLLVVGIEILGGLLQRGGQASSAEPAAEAAGDEPSA